MLGWGAAPVSGDGGTSIAGAREENVEGGAFAEFGGDNDVATGLFDDAVAGGETEAGAFVATFGGVERFEDVGFGFVGHAGAGIGDGEEDTVTVRDADVGLGEVFFDGDVAGADGEFAAGGHGVVGVNNHVDDNLFHLAGVGFDGPRGGRF